MQLILHIGQHKTGSKALQYFLSRNQKQLIENQIDYSTHGSNVSCSAYEYSHYHWYQQLKNDLLTQPQNGCQRFAQTLFNHVQLAQANGAKCTIISAEDFWVMQTAHTLDWDESLLRLAVRTIREATEELNIQLQVVIYVKKPIDFLKSSYAQYIKGESRGTLSLKKFSHAFEARLNTGSITHIWREELPDGALQIRPYVNPVQADIRVDFVQHVLGLALQDFDFSLPKESKLRREVLNQSPNPWQLSYQRWKNIVKA